MAFSAQGSLARAGGKRQVAISLAPALNRVAEDLLDAGANFADLMQHLRRWPALFRRRQAYHLVSIVADQLQVDNGIQYPGDQTGIARDGGLQRNQVQALVVDDPVLMVGLGFQFTGSGRK